ncbi:hypothetical protein HYG86_03535 [Alkalicella caledoniensis]|uniref:Uncharacterized protein n=1 Tax=Alkalicella caledoniensis TaxID=2731377 RepID=A0A7G9W5E2_ALKCA|nr:hypothetical protein [Alkalicella caledoniensis]QNO13904.1 hypothetical protein HYG86_03535 [Alkalicella caledoniensis]
MLLLYVLTNLLKLLNKNEDISNGELVPIDIDEKGEEVAAITAALIHQLKHNNFQVNRIYVNESLESPKWNFKGWASYFHRN